MTDYYALLGVSPDATDDDIKKQYRLLSKKYHPDVGGSQKRMAAVNEAARVLLDPLARADYDESLDVVPESQAPQRADSEPEPSQRRTPEPLTSSLWGAIATSVVIVALAITWAIVRNNLEPHPAAGTVTRSDVLR